MWLDLVLEKVLLVLRLVYSMFHVPCSFPCSMFHVLRLKSQTKRTQNPNPFCPATLANKPRPPPPSGLFQFHFFQSNFSFNQIFQLFLIMNFSMILKMLNDHAKLGLALFMMMVLMLTACPPKNEPTSTPTTTSSTVDPAKLSVEANLDFGKTESEKSFSVKNDGGETLSWDESK